VRADRGAAAAFGDRVKVDPLSRQGMPLGKNGIARCRESWDNGLVGVRRRAAAELMTQQTTPETLAGLVERVTYHNAENGFCVLRAQGAGIVTPSGS